MTIVQVKWQKQKFSVNIDKTQPIRVFQEELYRLTQVPPERQTILGFQGGKLSKDKDWNSCGLKENMSIVLIGSADEVRTMKKKREREMVSLLFSHPC